jgi:hypothetical protein
MVLLNVASSLLVRWSASNHISSSSHDYLVGNMLTAIRRVYIIMWENIVICSLFVFFVLLKTYIPNWTFGIKMMRSRLVGVAHHCSIQAKVRQVTRHITHIHVVTVNVDTFHGATRIRAFRTISIWTRATIVPSLACIGSHIALSHVTIRRLNTWASSTHRLQVVIALQDSGALPGAENTRQRLLCTRQSLCRV